MVALSASQSRAADSTSVCSTVCRSKAERLMTFSTSAVAVCCCNEFAQFLQQPRILDGDDRLFGKIAQKRDLLIGERLNFLAINRNRADKITVPEHRDDGERSRASEV